MKNEEKLTVNRRVSKMVLELQVEASDTSIKVSKLLGNAYTLAIKLEIIDQEPWIQFELNGYSDEDPGCKSFPPYRFVKSEIECEKYSSIGTVFYDPFSSGSPASYPHEHFQQYPCHVSVSEIERTLNDKTNDKYVRISLPPHVEEIFINGLEGPPTIVLTVQASRLHGILDAVRTRIRDWALKLEEDGIIVEEPPVQTGAGEPKKPAKKRAYIQWPKSAQKDVAKLWVSFRSQEGGRELDCYERHKETTRLPDCIKSFNDFKKCKECAKKNGIIPPLKEKRGKNKGKPCQ